MDQFRQNPVDIVPDLPMLAPIGLTALYSAVITKLQSFPGLCESTIDCLVNIGTAFALMVMPTTASTT